MVRILLRVDHHDLAHSLGRHVHHVPLLDLHVDGRFHLVGETLELPSHFIGEDVVPDVLKKRGVVTDDAGKVRKRANRRLDVARLGLRMIDGTFRVVETGSDLRAYRLHVRNGWGRIVGHVDLM